MSHDLAIVRVSVALVLLFVLTRCTTYDRPTFIKSLGVKPADLVLYRKLRRDDFRAPRPPEGITDLSLAAICTQIVFSPHHTRLQVASIQTAKASQEYEATLTSVGFHAVANRACSWWSPDSAWIKTDEEILEHEQVHFAITELAARELNIRAAEMIEELRSVGDTPVEAIVGINWNSIRRVRQDFLKQDDEFDREMSVFVSRARQQVWLRRVESELRDTQDYAR